MDTSHKASILIAPDWTCWGKVGVILSIVRWEVKTEENTLPMMTMTVQLIRITHFTFEKLAIVLLSAFSF